MEIIDRRELAKEAVERHTRFLDQNIQALQTRLARGPLGSEVDDETWFRISKHIDDGKALLALGERPSVADVEQISGRSVGCRCGECEGSPDFVVQVGESPDYESATAWLCLSCLEKAVELLKNKVVDSPTR